MVSVVRRTVKNICICLSNSWRAVRLRCPAALFNAMIHRPCLIYAPLYCDTKRGKAKFTVFTRDFLRILSHFLYFAGKSSKILMGPEYEILSHQSDTFRKSTKYLSTASKPLRETQILYARFCSGYFRVRIFVLRMA